MDDKLIKKTFEEMKKGLPETGKCPDDADLSCFIEGSLDERESERIEEHLISCSKCCDYVVSFNRVVNFSAEDQLPEIPDEQIRKVKAMVKEGEKSDYSESIMEKIAQLTESIREFIRFDWMAQPIPIAVKSGAVALFVVLIGAAAYFYYQQGGLMRDEAGRVMPLGVYMEVIGKSSITKRDSPAEKVINEGDTLFSNDYCRVNFELDKDGYAYVLYYDSTGNLHQLYPDPATETPQKVKGNTKYTIPEEENRWFQLDDSTGTEMVFVLASHKPIRGLKGIFDSVQGLSKTEALKILAAKADALKILSFNHM